MVPDSLYHEPPKGGIDLLAVQGVDLNHRDFKAWQRSSKKPKTAMRSLEISGRCARMGTVW
jgi:hypothetical protein